MHKNIIHCTLCVVFSGGKNPHWVFQWSVLSLFCGKCSPVELLFWKARAGTYMIQAWHEPCSSVLCVKVHAASAGRQEVGESVLTVIYFCPGAAGSVRRRWQLLFTTSDRILFVFLSQKVINIPSEDARTRQVVDDLHPAAAGGQADGLTAQR